MHAGTHEGAFDAGRVFLTPEDVDRLLEDNSIDSRIDVVKKVSNQYVARVFNEQELIYAEQIFRLLMRDTEIRVRAELSRCLQHADEAPRDVLLTLANDHERIATPIIESSDVLSDADLIRIIENSREVGKIERVASRDRVSERVSHALVETHYPQVIRRLLENEGATIAGRDYDTIIDEHKSDTQITELVAQRDNLPLPIVEKVIHHVGDHIAEQLKETYHIEVEEARQQSQASMILQLMTHHSPEADIEETVKQMKAFDRLTPSVVISALCRGQLRFFEIALAKLANIPKPNAHKLVRDRGAYGFEALYDKAGLPESMFEPVKLLLQAVLAMEHQPNIEPGSKLYIGMVIDQMTEMSAGQNIENLPYLLELVRRSA